MKLRITFLYLVLFFAPNLWCQNNFLDSLLNVIKSGESDTNKVLNIYTYSNEVYTSEPLKTLDLCKEAVSISEKLNYNYGMAEGYSWLGYLMNEQGSASKGLYYHFKSLELRRKMNHKDGISESLNNIGYIFRQQQQLDDALKYYEEALKIRKEIGNKKMIAQSLNNIGYIYNHKHDYDKALKYYQESLDLKIEFNDKKTAIANSYNNLAMIYSKKNNEQKSLEYLLKASKLQEESSDNASLPHTYVNIGRTYLKLNKTDLAFEYAQKANVIANKTGIMESRQMANDLLAETYELKKDYQNALKHHKISTALEDSLINKESKKATLSIEIKKDFELKLLSDSLKSVQDLELRDLKIKEKDLTIKKQNTKTIAIIISLILVGIVAMVLFFSFRNQKRSALELAKKNKIIFAQKREVEEKNNLIEEHQKEIIDSIHYAKRIQNALLVHKDFLDENLKNNFIYYNPKDIVSGDFYWATKVVSENQDKEIFFLAVCDSTGHGVPGAFMSVLNIGFLNEAINEKKILEPNEIFNYVKQRLIDAISAGEQKDGFDGILIKFEKSNGMLKTTYAAANNRPILIKNNELIELNCDRMPVGKSEHNKLFSNFEIELESGDQIYLYTDGYPDQFGGPNGKKFKYKQLNNLLLANYKLNLEQQQLSLKNSFENWKGSLEQVDDIVIIGVKI